MKEKPIKSTEILEKIQRYSLFSLFPSLALGRAFFSIMLGVVLFTFFLTRFLKRERIIELSPINKLIILFYLFLLFSAGFSEKPYESIIATLFFARWIILYFIVCFFLRDKENIKPLLISVAIGGIFVVCTSLIELILNLKNSGKNLFPTMRIKWPFRWPAYLGLYLSVALPAIIWIYRHKIFKNHNLVFSIVFLSFALVFVFSGTKGFYISVMASMVFLILFTKGRKALLPVIFVLAVVMFFSSLEPIKRFTRINESSQVRGVIYGQKFDLIKQKPFLGHGMATFMGKIDLSSISDSSIPRAPHNIFLEIAYSGGFFSLTIFFTILILLWEEWLRQACRRDMLARAVATSMVSLLVFGLVDFSFFSEFYPFLFWFFLAILYSYISTPSQSEKI